MSSKLFLNGKFNNTAIMRQAHEVARSESPVLIKREGYRRVFGWCLSEAWKQAKAHKRRAEYVAPVLSSATVARIEELKAQKTSLEMRDRLGVSGLAQLSTITAEIHRLAA